MACVEVNLDGADVVLRDSKYGREATNDPARQPVVTLSRAGWQQLLDHVALGTPLTTDEFVLVTAVDGDVAVRHHGSGVTLAYTAGEWSAFAQGVVNGEFSRPVVASIA